MTRWFNIAGPCFADEHYLVPVEPRAAEARELIEQGRWFSLVSGRQTGKTTVLKALARDLGASGRYAVLSVDLETARGVADVAAAMPTILDAFQLAARTASSALPAPSPDDVARWLAVPSQALVHYLDALVQGAGRPLVLLLDEADVLIGPAMVSFLTQLRAVYLARDVRPAPHAVVLSGVRAVRDYQVSGDAQPAVSWLGSASPFNVTVEDVTLPAFTRADVEALVAQHTAETGQRFEPDAIDRLHALTAGHPWLVNALADQATRRDVKDRAVAITAAHVDAAKETLILERRTHLDSLLARLREPRVRRVLDPMIAGGYVADHIDDDDLMYVASLGLITRVPAAPTASGAWRIANPIYREIIPRALTAVRQSQLDVDGAWYVRADGLLDVPKLMAAWQSSWRKDGQLAAEGFDYRESGPHLMLMAFLQRVVNGGGRIDREYALGKGALELLVTWRTQRVALELKLRRDTETEAEALDQLERYLDKLGLDEGWLVLFDRRATTPWEDRLLSRTVPRGARQLHVVGC